LIPGITTAGSSIWQEAIRAQKFADAFRLASDMAKQSYPPGEHALGYLYDHGYGVKQDLAQAATWYRKAADNGSESAMSQIGLMYREGYGVAQDNKKALDWYRKAAKKGDATALWRLGMMYADGSGVAQDFKKAMKLYLEAVDKGESRAMLSISAAYREGYGVPQDEDKAVEWKAKWGAAEDKENASIVKKASDVSQQFETPPFLVISDLTFSEPSGNKILDAFETGSMQLNARNEGKGPAKDIKLQIVFSDKAHCVSGLIFNETTNLGTIQPGDEKKIDVDITALDNVPTASVELKAILVEGNGLD
jgi:alpha/beta superfamily hydrolase